MPAASEDSVRREGDMSVGVSFEHCETVQSADASKECAPLLGERGITIYDPTVLPPDSQSNGSVDSCEKEELHLHHPIECRPLTVMYSEIVGSCIRKDEIGTHFEVPHGQSP